eukprot:scaffold8318_cov99-Isochrysis_galbana.AAC.6
MVLGAEGVRKEGVGEWCRSWGEEGEGDENRIQEWGRAQTKRGRTKALVASAGHTLPPIGKGRGRGTDADTCDSRGRRALFLDQEPIYSWRPALTFGTIAKYFAPVCRALFLDQEPIYSWRPALTFGTIAKYFALVCTSDPLSLRMPLPSNPKSSSGCGLSSFRIVPSSPPATGARWPGRATMYFGRAAAARPFLETGMPAPSGASLRRPRDGSSTDDSEGVARSCRTDADSRNSAAVDAVSAAVGHAAAAAVLPPALPRPACDGDLLLPGAGVDVGPRRPVGPTCAAVRPLGDLESRPCGCHSSSLPCCCSSSVACPDSPVASPTPLPASESSSPGPLPSSSSSTAS